MENGYSICLNKWALDKDIKSELGLLLIISSLCAEKGYCYANNKYLSELFGVTEISISTKIKKLEEKGYIEVSYKKRGCEVIERYIRLKNILIDDLNFFKSTVKENFKENNNNINNNKEIYNNKLLYTKKKEKKEFVPPTLEEIKEYCLARKNNVNWKKFYDYYTENNWKDAQGKQVNNWKLKVISWEGTSTNTFNKNNQVRNETKLPSWFDKDIQPIESTEEEKAEMERVMAELNSLL